MPAPTSSTPAKIGLVLTISGETRAVACRAHWTIVIAKLKAVHAARYPPRNAAVGTYGWLRSRRARLTAAKINTVGVTDGSIMPTIMMVHMTKSMTTSTNVHAVNCPLASDAQHDDPDVCMRCA